MRTSGWFKNAERGQVLLATALLVPVLLGMAAIAVDIGSYADDRRDLQNDADAIALAAAQQLCKTNPSDCSDTAAATAAANTYALKNNIDPIHMTLTYSGLTPTGGAFTSVPTAHVSLTRTHTFAFARIFGVDQKDVDARAGAARVSAAGVPGAVPFGITLTTFDGAAEGQTIALKYDASGGSTSGNFGPIDIDGTGNPPYLADLQSGSPSVMCSVQMPGCTQAACQSGGAFAGACPENAPSCTGPVCSTETGNKISGTKTGIQYRLDHTSANCDTFAQVFTPTGGTSPKYALNANCNPWAGPGACPAPPDDTGQSCSRRVIVVPIIDAFTNGKKPVTVQAFALMYLNGFASGNNCTGSDCQISGIFVDADVSMNALSCKNGAPATCVYDPSASIHFTRLVE